MHNRATGACPASFIGFALVARTRAVIVLGHRGARAIAPENTRAAFAAALSAGAAGSEFDVRTSADGALVCVHDATVDVGGSERRVCDATVAELRDSIGVLTLDEALVALAGAIALVEIKNQPWDACYDASLGIAEAVAAAVPGDAIVACFDPASLARVHEVRPEVRTAVITPVMIDPASNLEAAVAGGHAICSVEHDALTPVFVGAAHEAGRQVFAWTTDEPQRVRELATWGVDALMCDDPARALAALRA